MKPKFKTNEDVAVAINKMSSLLEHPGWIFLQEILKENVEFLKNKLCFTDDKDETIDEVKRIRNRLQIYQELIDTPMTMIQKMMNQGTDMDILDPYFDDIEELKKSNQSKK